MFSDEQYMKRALQLAALGGVKTAPNPMVGAVIVHNGIIIGEGYHEQYGGPHAEVNAVNSVADKSLLKESTIYVTLEPCAHFGKTPPCANLLVEHQFKRVVVATRDPFDQVDGKGIEKVKAAGIEVTLDVLKDEAQLQNKRFFTFHKKKRPYVILKWAQTADGFVDTLREEGQQPEIHWISGKASQVITHKMRGEEQAILVGRKTVENDNPSLTTRAVQGESPIRIVIDPQLNIPANATIFQDGGRTVVLNTFKTEENGAVSYIQATLNNASDITNALYDLQINSVIIEGGPATLQRFIDENLWDEALVIKGVSRFEKGIKAPIFAVLPDSSTPIEEDIHYRYTNKTNAK